ncbi:MAG: hypothetical protein OEV81_00930 [Betaproteobacteria bacterium]|nr:hypothetical protein [Betaproteobacteria bacterium]MDH5220878.1 hypothetical protein [Betaproteobacteria bacterium]MDH5349256.1 hypothetical protein [Betaproteobacteria bacterium]
MTMTVGTTNSKACEIYSVLRKNALLWKWRSTGADGGMTACAEEYALFFQCAAAARARGYEPRSDWTGPCASVIARREAAKTVLPK